MLNKKAIAATAAGVETDGDFNQTVLLLHGDGTNGAQNNTFTDSSTNNFTITRNGNTTQGTFSPFSQTGWSNYFDGNGDYLSLAASSDWAFGTGDFTIEFWINCANHNSQLLSLVGGTSAGYWQISLFSGDMYFQSARNSTDVMQRSATSILDNKWHHVAITRSGTTVRMFFDGALQGSTATDSTNYNISSSQLNIGYSSSYFTGYLSNVRILKGTAQYTSAFTPETSALTAITNTKLLTCQSNRFKDSSSNAFAITVNGNTSVQAFSPFAPTAAYSAATNGGSGYFDGSGDYLSLPSSSNLSVGTGDYTIECWFYPTAAQNSGLFQLSTDSSGFTTTAANQLDIQIYNGNIYFGNDTGLSKLVTTFTIGMWHHIAVVRNSGTVNIYVNGVSKYSVSDTYNYTGTYFTVGGFYSTGNTFNGYISGFRLVKGSAVYTSGFTPPTAPPTAISNTQLLCNFTNAGIIDSTAKNVLETVGNAQISTSVKKYGTGSLSFAGNGDSLTLLNTPQTKFGTGAMTIECWIYPTSNPTGGYGTIVADWTTGASPGPSNFTLYIDNSNLYFQATNGNFNYYDASSRSLVTSYSKNTWTHIAVTFDGTTLRLFRNGTIEESNTFNGFSTNSGSYTNLIKIGGQPSYGFIGYIDDLRITKGVARYTTNFTAPTKAFPDQ